jgi:hypothetical protein
LALFIRDIAGGDLVNWIDQQLAAGDTKSAMTLASARDALIGPLRNVYGVSDKVLAMALAGLLMGGAGKRRPLWFRVGASFIVIDTLVHNFLHRTRILQRFDADHPYGLACYHPGGCREILDLIAARIDALNAISLMSLGDSRRDTYVIRGPRSFEVLSGSAILGTDLASFGSRFEIVYLACFKEYLFSEPRNFRVQIGLVSHPCRKRYHMST